MALFRERGQHEAAEELRQRVLVRMWDVSAFMKALKQRFSQWYNRRNERKGTLWEERFKSVLVEGAGDTLATIAAYIDLNPVRANMIEDPKDYRFCGYAAAVAGDKILQEGLATFLPGEKDVLAAYREKLYGKGEMNEGTDQAGRPLRLGFDPEKVQEVLARKGRLPLFVLLLLRVRYFTDGAVLGSQEYVNRIFAAYRARWSARRKDGARRLKFLAGAPLYALRDLRVNPVTLSV